MNASRILVPLVAVAMLAALYVVFRPGPEPAADAPAPVAARGAERAPPPRVFVDAPAAMKIMARVGEAIDIDVSSSQAGEASAHGLSGDEYAVSAGGVTRIRIPASRAGHYALHFHGANGQHVPLATIEVAPR